MSTSREKPKRAPVQGWPAGIPWELHLEAYAAYCKRWSPQPALIDLEGRNCRGGFSTDELDEFVPGWRERVSEITALRAECERLRSALGRLVEQFNAYRAGWLGKDVWRDRIGLQDDLDAAGKEL